MKQKLVNRAVTIAGLLALLAASAVAAGPRRLSIPDTSGIPFGKTVVIPVRIDSTVTSADSVISYQLQINFNPSVLKLDSVLSQGTLTASFGTYIYTVTPGGTINIAAASSTPLTAPGILLYLRFIGKGAGYSSVSFTDTLHNFFNQNTGITRVFFKNGSVNVNPPPTITLSPSSGLYVVGEQQQFTVYGGKAPYKWSVTDTTVASISATGLMTAVGRGLTRVVVVDSSGTADTTTGVIEVRSVKLMIPDTTSFIGYTFDVPIRTTNLTGLGILSGQVTITYDATHLTPIAIIQTGGVLASFGSVTPNLSAPGTVGVSFAETSYLTGSGVLFYIRFTASTMNAGYTAISISNAFFNQGILAKVQNGSVNVQGLGSLTLYRRLVNLIVGDTMTFSITNATVNTPPFKWSTSDTSIASIDSTGRVTAKKSGSFTVSAKDSVGRTGTSAPVGVFNAFVAIGDLLAGKGAVLDVPVILRRASAGFKASALDVTVQYDTSFMKAVGIVTTGTLTSGWTFAPNNLSGVTVRLSAATGTAGFTTTGTMVIFRFAVSPTVGIGYTTNIRFVQVMMNDGTSIMTFDGTARIVSAASTPSLISPSNGATNVSTFPTFTWSQPTDAQSYRLQVAIDTAFTMIALDDSTLVVALRQVSLSTSTTYYWRVNAKNAGGTSAWSVRWSFTTGSVSGVRLPGGIPDRYLIEQNYPNPFNPSTTIQYGLKSRSSVRLEVYNMLGQRIDALVASEQEAGFHAVVWYPAVSSGVYFYRLEAKSLDNAGDSFVQIRKMTLMK